MDGGGHAESGLIKSVWSDADFDEMGWHDATIHGLCVERTADGLPRLLFDLDYIVRWVHPVAPEVYFSFWVAPATLAFDAVGDLGGDLDFKGMSPDLEVADLHRLAPQDGWPDRPGWHVEGHAFELTFHATGYRQYFRQVPRLVTRKALPHAERGGCSFAEVGFS
jgi:hypothetical protein